MIVIGAGIIGLTCAWRLAQRGLPVTVLDAHAAGTEATWAAAGMLAPGGEFDSPGAHTTMALQSLSAYPAFVRELEEASGVAIDFRVCGAIETAFSDAEEQSLERKALAQMHLGIRSERFSYQGHPARIYPDDALINPRTITSALIEACRRLRVDLHQDRAVTAVDRAGNYVDTVRGRLACGGVVIAAGAWSSRLYPGLRESFPVRGHMIGWKGTGDPGPILRNGHTYIAQRGNGVFVAGSSTERVGFDRPVDPAVLADIKARVARLMPSAHTDNAEAWTGLRPGIKGEGPSIEHVTGTRVFTAYGHYRNGILLAPETGRRVADLVMSSQETGFPGPCGNRP